MIIDKEFKGLADEGYRYRYDGGIVSAGSIEIKLDKGLYVTGSIKAGRSIKADQSIKACRFIEAGEYITAGRFIEAGGSIKAGWSIEAGRSIKAGRYIEAGQSIVSQGIKTQKYFCILGLRWPVYVWDTHIKVGCEMRSKEDWQLMSEEDIKSMNSNALEFYTDNTWLLTL